MTTEELKNQFNFPYNGFSDPIDWTDGIGFSLVKKFPEGYASLLKVGILDKEDGPLKNLWISISHGKETDNGIRLGEDKDGAYGPIDLDSHDEYFFNVEENCFYQNSKKIGAQQILSNIEEAHMRPTKKVRGLPVRLRLMFWRIVLPAVIKYIDIALIKLLWIFSGESVTDDIWKRILFGVDSELSNKPIPKPEVQFKVTKTLAFFGNDAKRWSVVFTLLCT